MRAAGLIAIGASALAVAQAPDAPQAPVATAPEDIVVVAQKLRRVGINYVAAGRVLRSCSITRSSGDARIDRIMCALVRTCVRQGHESRAAAQHCVRGRLGLLDSVAADAAREPVVAAEPLPVASATPVPAPTQAPATQPSATPRPSPVPGDIVVTGERLPPEITITGTRVPVTAGYWLFIENGTFLGPRGGGLIRQQARRMCLRPDALEATLLDLLNRGVGRSCRWRVQVADGTIAGDYSCTRRGSRVEGSIEGSYTPARMTFRHRRTTRMIRTGDAFDLYVQGVGRRTSNCR